MHHVGVVLPNHEAATRYREKLNLPVLAQDFVEAFSCDCIFVGREMPCVELIIPRGGRLANFNEGRGGLHHVAYRIGSIKTFMASFEGGKGRWLYPEPILGGFKLLANFLAPTHVGILTEFVEETN
jgi:lactoylglutathione lyase/methylmalonyl-CoA/ethylmalonyl-CoA epimerase